MRSRLNVRFRAGRPSRSGGRSNQGASGPVTVPYEFIAATSGATNHGSNTVTLTTPVSAAAGDTLFIIGTLPGDTWAGTWPDIADFSLLHAASITNYRRILIYAKRYAVAPPASYAIDTSPNSAGPIVWHMIVVRGGDALREVGTSATSNAIATSLVAPSITLEGEGDLRVVVCASASLDLSVSNAQGMTNRSQNQLDSSADTESIVMVQTVAGAGPHTGPTFAHSNNYIIAAVCGLAAAPAP